MTHVITFDVSRDEFNESKLPVKELPKDYVWAEIILLFHETGVDHKYYCSGSDATSWYGCDGDAFEIDREVVETRIIEKEDLAQFLHPSKELLNRFERRNNGCTGEEIIPGVYKSGYCDNFFQLFTPVKIALETLVVKLELPENFSLTDLSFHCSRFSFEAVKAQKENLKLIFLNKK